MVISPKLDQLLHSAINREACDLEAFRDYQALIEHGQASVTYHALAGDQSLSAITERLQLLRKVYPDLSQLCQTLMNGPDSPLPMMWLFWLPLAQWIDEQQQRLKRPLIQGILGMQGTGKTTLALILSRILAQLGHGVCCLSIDDFYKSYSARQQLQRRDPRLVWRGPPGTHDIDLALSALQQLRAGLDTAVPRFDKSAHRGQGDRAAFETVAGVTVVLFEGWFVGAQPLPAEKFRPKPSLMQSSPLPWPIESEADYAFAHDCNERLRDYLPLWEQVDRLLVLHPSDYRLSQRWRREAEQTLVASGQSGMDDAEVDRFVHYFWRALHPELFITPLLCDRQRVDLVVEIDPHHQPQRIYAP
ncbi:MAG: glycerate kinase [Elainellaceae cyanobacterium]